jgi:integrase
LKKVLDRYIELMDIKDDQFILFPTDTKRTSGSAMTKALNRIFGKKVGASMLRHSYLTSKYGKVTDEMAKDAELMAHSVSQQSDYIKE